MWSPSSKGGGGGRPLKNNFFWGFPKLSICHLYFYITEKGKGLILAGHYNFPPDDRIRNRVCSFLEDWIRVNLHKDPQPWF